MHFTRAETITIQSGDSINVQAVTTGSTDTLAFTFDGHSGAAPSPRSRCAVFIMAVTSALHGLAAGAPGAW